jgi:hypothetical protein
MIVSFDHPYIPPIDEFQIRVLLVAALPYWYPVSLIFRCHLSVFPSENLPVQYAVETGSCRTFQAWRDTFRLPWGLAGEAQDGLQKAAR